MKRALVAAAFGGLLLVVGPQAAFGGTTRPVAPMDHNADHKADDAGCAGKTEGSSQPEQSPPQSRGDHSDDDGTILF